MSDREPVYNLIAAVPMYATGWLSVSDVNEIPQAFSFTTVKDPVSEPKHGDKLQFNSVLPRLLINPRFEQVQDWRKFEGLVLALAFADINGDTYSVLGTAVMVAPGVALSVAHVLRDQMEQLASGQKTLMCIGVGNHGVHAWHVMWTSQTNTTDVCILALRRASELPPDRTFHQASLSTRTPSPGESVLMVGFRASGEKFERKDDGVTKLAARMYVSSGPVVQCYPQGRDSVMIPWPTFEIDGPAIGGMSGGPVFDSRGYLVGIVSSSFDCGPDQEPTPTFAAQHWPVLDLPFLGGWPPMRDPGESATLLSLGGLCSIERPEAVQAISDGPKSALRYSFWS